MRKKSTICQPYLFLNTHFYGDLSLQLLAKSEQIPFIVPFWNKVQRSRPVRNTVIKKKKKERNTRIIASSDCNQGMCIPVHVKFPLLFSGLWTLTYPKLWSLPVLPGNLNSNHKLSSLRSLGKPPRLRQIGTTYCLLFVDHLEFFIRAFGFLQKKRISLAHEPVANARLWSWQGSEAKRED